MKEQEIKALFFAQYLGQNICEYSDLIHRDRICRTNHFSSHRFTDSTLLLRTLSQLTNDEKIEIAKLVCARHNRHYQPEDISYKISKKRDLDIILIVKGGGRYIVQITSDGVAFIDYYMGGAGEQHYYCPAQYSATQLMLAYGILLPFTYLDSSNKPQTLQPDEIIAKGWAKINTP